MIHLNQQPVPYASLPTQPAVQVAYSNPPSHSNPNANGTVNRKNAAANNPNGKRGREQDWDICWDYLSPKGCNRDKCRWRHGNPTIDQRQIAKRRKKYLDEARVDRERRQQRSANHSGPRGRSQRRNRKFPVRAGPPNNVWTNPPVPHAMGYGAPPPPPYFAPAPPAHPPPQLPPPQNGQPPQGQPPVSGQPSPSGGPAPPPHDYYAQYYAAYGFPMHPPPKRGDDDDQKGGPPPPYPPHGGYMPYPYAGYGYGYGYGYPPYMPPPPGKRKKKKKKGKNKGKGQEQGQKQDQGQDKEAAAGPDAEQKSGDGDGDDDSNSALALKDDAKEEDANNGDAKHIEQAWSLYHHYNYHSRAAHHYYQSYMQCLNGLQGVDSVTADLERLALDPLGENGDGDGGGKEEAHRDSAHDADNENETESDDNGGNGDDHDASNAHDGDDDVVGDGDATADGVRPNTAFHFASELKPKQSRSGRGGKRWKARGGKK